MAGGTGNGERVGRGGDGMGNQWELQNSYIGKVSGWQSIAILLQFLLVFVRLQVNFGCPRVGKQREVMGRTRLRETSLSLPCGPIKSNLPPSS